MKTDIENITLINKYIYKELSTSEILAFEERLKTDKEFEALFTEQKIVIEGIKRQGLKAEIQAAKQSYFNFKWLKISGISLSCLLFLLVVWQVFFKQQQVEIVKPNIEANPVIVTDDKDGLKDTEQNNSIISEDSFIVENDLPEKSTSEILKEEAEPEIQELKVTQEPKEATEKVVVEDSVKTTEDIKIPEDSNYVFGSLFKSVKKEPQIIEVNTEKAFSITLKEGTILKIQKHTFVDSKTGKLVRGKIQLEVTEYYKLSDMLLADLSTTSNGKLLETGGMLYLEANKNGKKLELQKPIQMEFPFKNKKPNMQLFSGDGSRDIINWVPENNGNQAVVGEPVKAISFLEEHVEVPFDIVENVPVFPGCEGGTNEALKTCFNTKINRFFSKNFDIEIAKELGLTGLNRVNVFFKIDGNGNVFGIRISASSATLGNEIFRVLQELPKFRPALQRGRAVTVPYYMPFEFDLPGVTKNLPMVTVRGEDDSVRSFQMNNDSISVVNTKKLNSTDFNAYEVSSYALSSAKLGWLNCDAFVRDRRQKVKFKFKLKNGEGVNVKMIFKSMSSILPSKLRSEDIDFGLVPKNEEVVLVAVKKVDNTFYLGIKETQTKEISEVDFNFKPVTVSELKQEMIKLNDLINL